MPERKKIKYVICYLIPAFLVFISCSSEHNGNSSEKPNVILVVTDDQGYGDVGAHGSPYVKTPNLDQLYNESVRLTDFHVDPSCSPTRAALLTGQYSTRSGVWHTIGGRSLLDKSKTTIADIFEKAGYKTGIFGKWHLGENYPFRPHDRGFQETIVHGGGVVGSNPDYWKNNYYDDVYRNNGVWKQYEGYSNTVWFREALRFIKKNRDQPFFCYIPTNIPHAPLTVDEKYSEPYRSMVSERLANYYGMLTKFDEDLGTFREELKELQLAENTIFIYMSDNGPGPWFGGIKIDMEDGFVEEGYNAGMRGAKIWGYEGAHRVPFFIRWPAKGIGGGKDLDELTAHFDILPTLLDLADIDKPDSVNLDGMSLKPLLTNETGAEWPDRTIFVHNQREEFLVKYKDYQVLTEKWRLIGTGDKKELYNISVDSGQVNNIAAEHPDVVDRLTEEYETWWADISANSGEYPDIAIGSEHDSNPVLYAHDAHRMDQNKLLWAVDVKKAGVYEFNMYRWPIESDLEIKHEEYDNDEDVNTIENAHLTIGNISLEKNINRAMKSATFTVVLKEGETSLVSWFSGAGNVRSNYIQVRRIGPAVFETGEPYQPVSPGDFLE